MHPVTRTLSIFQILNATILITATVWVPADLLNFPLASMLSLHLQARSRNDMAEVVFEENRLLEPHLG